MSVLVSVYLFPAEGPTTFQGAFLSGFIPGPGRQGYESKVDYKAEPGKRATAVRVNGLVTDRPGEYPFRTARLADVPGHMDRISSSKPSPSASCRRRQPAIEDLSPFDTTTQD